MVQKTYGANKDTLKQFELDSLAYLVYRLLEGDDVADYAYAKLNKLGYTDSAGEWIDE